VKRRLGLGVAACLLGLSPLLAGLVALARGQAAARGAVDVVQRRDVPLPARLSAGPRLPKGCLLQLTPGRPERWDLLVERGVLGDRDLRPIRRLKRGQPAWVLRGQGPEAAIGWPRLALARRALRLQATGYDPGPVDNSRGWVGSTRSGTRARFGIAAVDPRVIRLGSLLYVEGYGPALAADVGGAIKGLRIDLCFNDSRQARAWGRRPARVWVVDPAPRAERASLRALAPL
jgi:3D (Asp-Asp-Asp) domain-containing protein